jgi:hypothetical protein
LAVLAVAMAVTGAFVLWETRGTYFWVDEWIWIVERGDFSAAVFLEPHNQHLSLVPLAIYRVLFETVGLDHYWPYRVVLVIGHLSCALLLFIYTRSRVGPVLGVAAAVAILFLGPAWQDILWPFQVAWLISMAAGVGALLALDRREPRADFVAAALLAVSLASSGVGAAFVVAAAVEVAFGRRRWRDGLIVAAPLALYALWWLVYQTPGPTKHLELTDVPLYVVRSACASLLSLFGLFRPDAPFLRQPHVSLAAGLAVLLPALGLAAWRLHRVRRVPVRLVALLAGVIAFWMLTAIQRGVLSPPGTSRYVYVGSLFLLLTAVELAHGTAIRRPVAGALAIIAVAAATYNVPLLREAATGLREQGDGTRVALGVLEIARPNVRPREVLTILPGHPLVVMTAGQYFAAERMWGAATAATPSQIAEMSLPSRQTADQELARLDRPSVRPAAARRPRGALPPVDAATGGRVERAGACVAFPPPDSGSLPRSAAVDLTLPRAGLLIRAEGGPATLSVRRFGDFFQRGPLATVASGSAVHVRIRPDRAPQPWHVRVRARKAATVCSAS